MEMKDLIKAEMFRAKLVRAEQNLETFTNMELVGITIKPQGSTIGAEVHLKKGSGGTGSVTSFGFPDDFQAYMNGCMNKYFQTDVEMAREGLRNLGIKL